MHNIRNEDENRKFVKTGTVRVSYEIKAGSVSPLTDELLAATPGEDFIAVKGYIDIEDGVSKATVNIQIQDDDLPEVDEVFVIQLTGVTLMDSTDSTMQPRLGKSSLPSAKSSSLINLL